ncbi:MAG: GNAT family N-acetyltransferase [Candidatus Hodarchaeales archaeon]
MSKIRAYEPNDEKNWIDCYLKSYSNSIYLNLLEETRPKYETKSLELVFEIKNRIIGIIDVEIEDTPGQLCLDLKQKSALINILGVSPEYRRQKIGTRLVNEAEKMSQEKYGINRFEVWVRESFDIISLFERLGYRQIEEFYEVYYREDFFDKFGIKLPFNLSPQTLVGSIDPFSFEALSRTFPPERSYRIVALEKILIKNQL